jgi:hypothetical protein
MKTSIFFIVLITIFVIVASVYAAEEITLSTYYPAPYGEYDELSANKMVIGPTYAVPANDGDLVVEGTVSIGTTSPGVGIGTKLAVAGDATATNWYGQIAAIGATNPNYNISMGFNTAAIYGWIQAGETGVGWENLILNPGGGGLAGGNVGIGETNPLTKLVVKADATTTNGYGQIAITGATNPNYNISMGFNTAVIYGWIQAGQTGVAWKNLILNPGGSNVGIGVTNPSYQLHLSTNSAGKPGGGSWSDSSDERLKTNVTKINSSDALYKLCQLNGVTYQWINPEEHIESGNASITAQNLEMIFPAWVKEYEPAGKDKDLIPEGEKAKSIHFPNEFYAYLIEAIKELRDENIRLKNRVDILETELNN